MDKYLATRENRKKAKKLIKKLSKKLSKMEKTLNKVREEKLHLEKLLEPIEEV